MATCEEECVGRNEESEVGGLIADAVSTFQTVLACFSDYKQMTMIEGSSGILCVFARSLASLGMTGLTK